MNFIEAVDYEVALRNVAEYAPSLVSARGPTKFFEWAETVADIFAAIYPGIEYEKFMEKLVSYVKEYQEFEDDED